MLRCPKCGNLSMDGAVGCWSCRESLQNAVRVLPEPPSPDEEDASAASGSRVVVTDIDMPFGSMVRFMVKWSIASIPAFLILLLLALLVVGVAGVLEGSATP